MSQGSTRRLGTRAAWVITGILLWWALVLTYATYQVDPSAPSWPTFIIILILWFGTLNLAIPLEVRREAIMVTAGEVPFILALFYLPPFWVVMARVTAGILVQLYRWATARVKSLKSVFNIVNGGVTSATVALMVHSIGLGSATDITTWLVLLLAIIVSLIINHLALALVITVTQGRAGLEGLISNVVSGLVIGGVNAVLGIIILIALNATPWAMAPLVIVAILFAGAYRGYSNLTQQRRALSDLNDFTQSVAQAVQSNRLVDIMTHRLRDMLNAEAATVWVPKDKRFPELLLTAYMDTEGLLDTTPIPAELRHHVMKTGEPLLATTKHGDPQFRELLKEHDVTDAVVVPLRSGTVTYGCLAVANQLGGGLSRFGLTEQRYLETLAAHAGVAVENSRLVNRLRFDAYHDALTELPNRRRTMSVLEESIAITVPDEIVAVMLFDVDGMREINDSIGHASGDRLIVEVGRRLKEAAPPAAHVGRIDGDEFAVVLRLPDAAAAVTLAGEIREALRQPCVLGSLNVDIDSAVGIAIHPESGDNADALLQRADVATQTAKNVASGIKIYNAGLESTNVRRLGLATDLRRAFDSDELHVHYQPKIALGTRELIGVECLARWQHPTHGDVPPDDFVPVAEHTGQLGRLTEFVLRDGLRRLREWSDRGYDLTIAVNLSPRTLVDSEFPDQVQRLLDEYRIDAPRLIFEITEDGMVGGKNADMLRRLRELGIRLSVDDFGKGYSSLSYLRALPAQEIKIDRSFVQGMATDEGDHAIVRAIIDLARHFRMKVVAEGVESEMTLTMLTDIGCDVAQGFYFSRPLSPDRFAAWMAAQESSGRRISRLKAA